MRKNKKKSVWTIEVTYQMTEFCEASNTGFENVHKHNCVLRLSWTSCHSVIALTDIPSISGKLRDLRNT